jgi:hypothetical protein
MMASALQTLDEGISRPVIGLAAAIRYRQHSYTDGNKVNRFINSGHIMPYAESIY